MKKLLFLLVAAGLAAPALAQHAWPFAGEIAAFKKADSLSFPEKGGILFTGSSSIRMWTDLKERFDGYAIIRRGFGGAELYDVVHYADQILLPYRPSKIFLYAGENDLANGRPVDSVYNKFLEFYRLVRKNLPETKIYFISVKPSPSRVKYMAAFKEMNKKVRSFMAAHACDTRFIDVFDPMLGSDGQPKPEIFREDRLHMNSTGYDIWEALIRKYL